MKNQPNPETKPKNPAEDLTDEELEKLRELLRIIVEDMNEPPVRGYGVFYE